MYDKGGNKYLILEEREDNLAYHCWAYTPNADLFRFEDELTREVVTEEITDDK